MSYRFPFDPFPTGWYFVALASELRSGQVLSRTICGEELVIFRTASGQAVATEAHCPHLGAHRGHGGTVVGETLRCPFHGFCFDAKGDCVSAYAGKPVPPTARTRTWPLREMFGILLVFHDPAGRAPTWEVPELDMTGWAPFQIHRTMVETHVQDTGENMPDMQHFAVVHGIRSIEMRGEPTVDGAHFQVTYAGKAPWPFFQPIELTPRCHGLGFVCVESKVGNGEVVSRTVALSTPIDRSRVEVTLLTSARVEKRTGPLRLLPPSVAARVVAWSLHRTSVSDVQKDIRIWENKSYLERPALAAGDGPIPAYRRWARQFYARAAGALAPDSNVLVAADSSR
jgi:nitrite reductase/ring-hydroxylating ferredoxin subunit